MSKQQGPAPLAIELVDQVASWYYKAPQRNQKGGFSNYIVRKQGDFERICFQATAQEGEPRCVAPFGISEPYDATKEDSNKRNFELNLHSSNLRKFLHELDENTKKKAVENYDAWFNSDDKKKKPKALTPEQIMGMYRPLIQEGDESKGYADTFRTKVIISGPNTVRVYVFQGIVNGEPVVVQGRLTDIGKFAEVVPIIEVQGMWFMSKQYGLSLTTTDVVVFPANKRTPGQFNFGGQVPKVLPPSQAAAAAGPDDMDIVPTEEQRALAAARAAEKANDQRADARKAEADAGRGAAAQGGLDGGGDNDAEDEDQDSQHGDEGDAEMAAE